MIPNMKHPVRFFSQSIQIIKRTQVNVNGIVEYTEEEESIRATVQPQGVQAKHQLGYDISIEVIIIHCERNFKINDIVVYHNKRYVINAPGGDYSDYGYYEYFAKEEIV